MNTTTLPFLIKRPSVAPEKRKRGRPKNSWVMEQKTLHEQKKMEPTIIKPTGNSNVFPKIIKPTDFNIELRMANLEDKFRADHSVLQEHETSLSTIVQYLNEIITVLSPGR